MLEIVLGIDNLIFIALVVQKLPHSYRQKARFIGIFFALGIRAIMLLAVVWVMSLTKPLFSVYDLTISIKDLLMIAGGLFLIIKSVSEMHHDMADEDEQKDVTVRGGFFGAVLQIILIDFVFSFDSVITAAGMARSFPIIFAAVIVSMIFMLAASGFVIKFLQQYPTLKTLALSFILLIGVMLLAEGGHYEIPRGYIYFAFAFSIGVEILNIRASKKRKSREI